MLSNILQIQLLVCILAIVSEMFTYTTCLEANSSSDYLSDDSRNQTEGYHCIRNEPLTMEVKKERSHPVRVRTTKWCLGIPPRCSDYKIEYRTFVEPVNVTYHSNVTVCCNGYTGPPVKTGKPVCKPHCSGGCENGSCVQPEKCECKFGYTGKNCEHRCNHGRFGEDCKFNCVCHNNGVCDNIWGICHCTSGWRGDMCEEPCPPGLHGIMCKKTCECSSKRCNPQTGECVAELPANVTTSMIETLNSTIVNITQNLDRIAKNLGTTETVTLLVRPDAIVEVTTPKTLQEVILIKPPDHPTPSIIVHQPGGASQTPEVIHLITNWQQEQLKASGDANVTRVEAAVPSSLDHESTLLTVLLVVLMCIMAVLSLGFLVIYKRFNFKRRVMANHADLEGDHTSIASKAFTKPLPDLPAFTQVLRTKVEGPEFYDSPTNNAAVKPPYCYARKESLYSVVPKSRKGSMDSHLYDEIRYPASHKISHM